MSGLDQLLQRIENESRDQAAAILKEAEWQGKQLLEKTRQDSMNERRLRLEKAEREQQSYRERMLSKIQLENRNKRLQAMQTVIEQVLVDARNRLSHLDGETFFQFLKDRLLDADLQGNEVLLLNRHCLDKLPADFLEQINRLLTAQGFPGQITVSAQKIDDGFILSREGVEMDFTFNALIDRQQDEMEAYLASCLFEEE